MKYFFLNFDTPLKEPHLLALSHIFLTQSLLHMSIILSTYFFQSQSCQVIGDIFQTNYPRSFKLKVHFVIHSLIPPFFSKKVEIFTSAEAFRYIMFVCKIFLANSLVWSNCLFIMST